MNEVTICNLALSAIGEDLIVSLDSPQPSRQEKYCRLHYPSSRDALLREHPWGFATARAPLALLSGISAEGYSCAYAYPSGCLMARKIFVLDSLSTPPAFEVMNIDGTRAIATDQDEATLEYTARVTDTNQFDVSFVQVLAAKLAITIAMPLTKSLPIAQAMGTNYQTLLLAAITHDSREMRVASKRGHSLLDSRK